MVVTGASTVIDGPVQIEGIQTGALTTLTISKNGVALVNMPADTFREVKLRSAGPITVALGGGTGAVTLYLRLDSNK